MVQSKLLARYGHLLHYFGNKNDLHNPEGIGIKSAEIITAEQLHGNKVVIIKNNKNKLIKGADGMITKESFTLGIRTADCLPIFFYDPGDNIIAAIHAGWKGLYKGIINNAITSMEKIGSKSRNIKAAVGPHIGACCYDVSRTRIDKFQNYKSVSSQQFLDLGKIAREQMLLAGIRAENIDISAICTNCDLRFWSFRRDRQKAGRMMNIIGISSN